MSYTAEEARKTGELLQKAANACVVRPTRFELYARGTEWIRAAIEMEDADEGEAVIELAGNVGVGMKVLGDDQDPWWPVRRVLGTRDGQFSVQVENPSTPQPKYRNVMGSASPMVVKA